MEQARERRTAILREHKASLAAREREHRAMYARQAAQRLQTESVRLSRAGRRTLSRKKLELKRSLIEKQAALTEELFAEVRALLEEYKRTPAYQELLIRQIRAILDYAGDGQVTIYIDPADAPRLQALTDAVHTPLAVSSRSFLGGTQALLTNRHIFIDNSFAARLEEEKAAFVLEGGACP